MREKEVGKMTLPDVGVYSNGYCTGMLIKVVLLLTSALYYNAQGYNEQAPVKQSWLINYPEIFHDSSAQLGDNLLDVRGDEKDMKFYKDFTQYFLDRVDGFTDG